jgi:hypothetical protein
MRSYTVGLHKVQTLSATVTVNASSPEEAKARAEDWLNNGQDWSDSDEFVTDHEDDPFAGHGLEDMNDWVGPIDGVFDNGEVEE